MCRKDILKHYSVSTLFIFNVAKNSIKDKNEFTRIHLKTNYEKLLN